MAFNESLGFVGGILRVLASILGRRPVAPEKHLRARIVMRAIVSELPSDVPLKIVDPSGREHRGVYVLNVLLWNRGSKEISPTDFLDNAPLRVALRKDSYIISADALTNDDQLTCSALQVDEHTVDIYFDCINPGDHLNIILFYGGESMADVDILGRIRGQTTGIDHQADEVKASIDERFVSLSILLLFLNLLVGLPLSAWIIHRDYGFERFLQPQPDIPGVLVGSFAMGIWLIGMFVVSRIVMWSERRKYPPGYPLRSDFEPRLLENLKGMILTVFAAKKQRLSTSIFDWAKPVIVRRKKSRRLTVDDWMA